MTTAGRRSLRYSTLDEIMPDVEHLLEGHSTVGNWSLAQICQHLATVIRRVVDMPASTPVDSSLWVGDEKKRQVFESGMLPEGIQGPPQVLPTENRGERDEADALRDAIAHYKASPTGPVIPHRFFGPLGKDEWEKLTLIHCAHHLSFANPKA
jgi:hypothetical protein